MEPSICVVTRNNVEKSPFREAFRHASFCEQTPLYVCPTRANYSYAQKRSEYESDIFMETFNGLSHSNREKRVMDRAVA